MVVRSSDLKLRTAHSESQLPGKSPVNDRTSLTSTPVLIASGFAKCRLFGTASAVKPQALGLSPLAQRCHGSAERRQCLPGPTCWPAAIGIIAANRPLSPPHGKKIIQSLPTVTRSARNKNNDYECIIMRIYLHEILFWRCPLFFHCRAISSLSRPRTNANRVTVTCTFDSVRNPGLACRFLQSSSSHVLPSLSEWVAIMKIMLASAAAMDMPKRVTLLEPMHRLSKYCDIFSVCQSCQVFIMIGQCKRLPSCTLKDHPAYLPTFSLLQSTSLSASRPKSKYEKTRMSLSETWRVIFEDFQRTSSFS